MSDISINLDGVITFLTASALGLLLLLVILIASLVTLIRARRKHEPFVRQGLFPQIVGMFSSLLCCVLLVVLLLYTDGLPRPRAVNIWLDRWLWVWLIAVLALWPVSAFIWKKLQRRQSATRHGDT